MAEQPSGRRVGLQIVGFFVSVVALFVGIAQVVPQVSSYPAKALSAEDLALVRRLLLRKHQLRADAYHDLVRTVAEQLAQKAGTPLSFTDDPEAFLQRIAGGTGTRE